MATSKKGVTVANVRNELYGAATPQAEDEDTTGHNQALALETALATVNNTKFTPASQQAYLDDLIRYGGKYRAANAAGVSYECTRAYRAENPEFEAQVEIAMGLHRDVMVQEAHRRAVDGWDERPILDNDGKIVGYVHKHSDRLLELLIKQVDPSFREHQGVQINNNLGQLGAAAEFKELATLSGQARHNLRAILEEMKANRDPVKDAIDVTATSSDSKP